MRNAANAAATATTPTTIPAMEPPEIPPPCLPLLDEEEESELEANVLAPAAEVLLPEFEAESVGCAMSSSVLAVE